ncbi:MAG: sugar phosphate isomerase/epimerase [Planctomycetes bacterium]|nr:sugar phosphate isomerase/epimerase [Planctomycetota bacterium]
MSVSRREMLAAAAAAAGAGVVGTSNSVRAAEGYAPLMPPREAKLRLSSQEGPMAGDSLAAKLDNCERWGFEGFEVGGRGLADRVKELQNALKGRPIKISAICAGFEGWLIADKKEIRDKCMASLKSILSAAGELGSTGVIIVPSFNGQDKQGSLSHQEARRLLTGFARWDEKDRKREGALLAELGDHAAKAGTRILLEPLNRQECYFLRTLADAASICRDVENPGVALMGDFWHMTWEETSDLGAFLTAGDYLHHVHMASRRGRKMPGEDGETDNYVQGFKGLKMIGYQDFVSLECGCKGDRETAVPFAAELLRKQWAEA